MSTIYLQGPKGLSVFFEILKLLRKRVDIGHSIPVTSITVICEVAEVRVG